jgi:3-hydroxyacyl-[acyl-carrier-protein] dehydratase
MSKLKQAVAAAVIGNVETTEGGAAFGRYIFPADFVGFEGHFPGYPVLPAIVQVLAAQHVIEQTAARPLRLTRLDKAKFHIRIGPLQEIRVECRHTLKNETEVWRCSVFADGELASSFRLSCVSTEVDQ